MGDRSPQNCVTVCVWPPRVMVAVLEVGFGLAIAVYAALPLPAPLAGAFTFSQDVSEETAVQAQYEAVLTDTLPDPPTPSILAVSGLATNSQAGGAATVSITGTGGVAPSVGPVVCRTTAP